MSTAPSAPAHSAPMSSCPSAPMLKSPARNASAMPSAGKSSAVVATSVSPISLRPPSAPTNSAEKPSIGLVPGDDHRERHQHDDQRDRAERAGKMRASSARHHCEPAIRRPIAARSKCVALETRPAPRRDTSRSRASASARISSSSNEMSSTAAPRLRASIKRDCTSAAAPTSMPRVGL